MDKYETLAELEREHFQRTGVREFKTWICKGKYYGHPMNSLPNGFIEWVLTNWENGSVGWKYANFEMKRRKQETKLRVDLNQLPFDC